MTLSVNNHRNNAEFSSLEARPLPRCGSSTSDTSATSHNTTDTSRTSHHQTTPPAWLERVERRIRHALANRRNPNRPLMIGICGIPGSGKSISSGMLQKALQDVGCVILPMDGYHYPRQTLSDDQVWRRGAPDTFDAAACVRDLRRVRDGNEPRVTLPGFSHAHGDPQPNQHVFVRSQHAVVLCEGLYLLHTAHGFESLSTGPDALMDWTMFVDAPLDVCVQRLKQRNQCIPGYPSPESVAQRVDLVDRINAELVQQTMHRAQVIVPVEELWTQTS